MTPPGRARWRRGHGAQGGKVKLFRILKGQAGQKLLTQGPKALGGMRVSRNSLKLNKNFHTFVGFGAAGWNFHQIPKVMTKKRLRTINSGQHCHGYLVRSQKLFFTAQELLDYINLTRNLEIIDKSEASSMLVFYLFPLLLHPTEMMVFLCIFMILQSQRKLKHLGVIFQT